MTTLFLLLLLPSLPLLLLSLYIKRRRRRRPRPSEQQLTLDHHPINHHDELPEWLPPPLPPPPPPPPPPPQQGIGVKEEERNGEEKRRKKKGRKKRAESLGLEEEEAEEEEGGRRDRPDGGGVRKDGVGKGGSCPFPFSSFASATQRKIKLQYDQLVKSNQAKALSMTQVGQFVNCLVEARNDLQHKSEVIQRSFKIKKALLFRADRSSFDRLCQQIYKLEAEHKRLEEDAAVFNLLQEQLKLSPAYKTLLEVSAKMELKATSDQAMEFFDISFEELLAQEKKDSFWQKYGKQRS